MQSDENTNTASGRQSILETRTHKVVLIFSLIYSVCMRVHVREGEWVVAGVGLPKHSTSNHAMKAHQRETQMYQALQTKAVNLFYSLAPAQSIFLHKKEKESSGLSFPHENPFILPQPIDEASCLFHLSRLCKLQI